MKLRLVAPLRTLPHQDAVLAWAKKRERIALFLQMRLGKSLITLRWLRQHGVRRALLLAPVEPLFDWRMEAYREGWDVIELYAMTSRQRLQWMTLDCALVDGPRPTLYLLNYEGLRTSGAMLASVPWEAVVCDESTRIRNPKAQITKLVTRHFDHVPYRAILSGLPNPEHPLDFFTQFVFSHDQFCGWSDYWAYRQRKFRSFDGFSWQPKPGVREEIKQFVAKHAYRLTRKQAGLQTQTEARTILVPSNAVQRKATTQLVNEMAYGKHETKWAPVVHHWLRRLAGGFAPAPKGTPPQLVSTGKMQAILRLLQGEFKGEPMVVWFAFNDELFAVRDFLAKHRYRVAVLHGGLKKTERRAQRAAFDNGDAQIFLVQLRLGLFGLNLSRADVAVYYSNSEEYEVRSQSYDRTEHLTKVHSGRVLHTIDLVTQGSADEATVELLHDKSVDAKSFSRQLASRVAADIYKYYVRKPVTFRRRQR